MGLESTARAWAHERGFQRSRFAVAAYRALSRARFTGRWDQPVEFRGHQFRIGRDLTLFPAVHNGGFEAGELDALLPLVPRDAVVWDVGANIGIYAVLLAAAAPDGHVEAFEPVPDSFERLRQNVAANSRTNVTTHRLALSSATGVALMAVRPDAHGCDQIDAELTGDAEGIQVDTTSGDAFLSSSGSADPDVVKVDIEGHEPQFLAGAWGMIERRKPLLMMEVNPTAWHTEAQVREWQEVLDRLFALYGSGFWFDTSTSQEVGAIDVSALDDSRAYTLLFRGRPR